MLINNIITAYILSEFDFIKIRPWFRRFNDNKWPESWHLHRSGFSIERTWKLGYTGKNVVIGVVDEGIEIDHPELKDSILTLIPYPTLYSKHGSACAGIIAAKPNNMFCTVGIAYNSRLVDFNINAKHRGSTSNGIVTAGPDGTCNTNFFGSSVAVPMIQFHLAIFTQKIDLY
ncbi:hypothetical protein ACOME3_004273 [Neoechinorhynchus agilis]